MEPLELDNDQADIETQLKNNQADALGNEFIWVWTQINRRRSEQSKASKNEGEVGESLLYPLLFILRILGLNLSGTDVEVQADEAHDEHDLKQNFPHYLFYPLNLDCSELPEHEAPHSCKGRSAPLLIVLWALFQWQLHPE